MNQDMTPQEMTSDEAAASLSIATNLMDKLLVSQNPSPEAPLEPQNAPGQEEIQEPQKKEPTELEEPQEEPAEPEEPEEDETAKKVDTLAKDLEGFKGEVKGIIEAKMDDLSKTIKDALKE